MAIYKLGDIVKATRGNSLFQKKDLKKSGDFVALHYGKTYKSEIVENDFPYWVDESFHKIDQIIRKGDFVLISTSETKKDLGKGYFYNNDSLGLLGGEQIKIDGNQDIINNKYLFYWFKINHKAIQRFATGLKVFRFKSRDLSFIKIDIPSLEEQQKIIDIIEQNEKLFLSHQNCVRIDAFQHTKEDMKSLIDIIEPFENSLNKLDRMLHLIKLLLINKYKLLKTEYKFLSEILSLKSNIYRNQPYYFATNGIGELSIDNSKVQYIKDNRPSRANLTPVDNSILLSKLDGDNKVLYIKKTDNVFSTGFFNIKTKCTDSVLGFFLSESFKKQKTNFSTGTTMTGLNNYSLLKIKMKKPIYSSELYKLLNPLLDMKAKLKETQNKLIKLLIK